MTASTTHLNFYYLVNESSHNADVTLNGHGRLNFWFYLPFAMKVALSLILIVNIGIGLVGKYAVLSRITTTGIFAYPINPLMFYHEIIYTAFRVSMISSVLLLFATGVSAQKVANWMSNNSIGVDTEFCTWFYGFVVFCKTSDIVGSWAVAVFR